MKKQKLQFLCGAIAMIGFTACSDTDNVNGDVAQDGSYVYNIEVAAGTDSTTHAATRTLKLDEQNNVLSRWAAGDKIFIYNTADNNQSKEQTYSTLTSKSGGSKGTSFQGTVKSKNPLKVNNKFAFFYPAAGLEEGSVGLVSTSEKKETNQGVTISYHDVSNTITEYVSLNMNKQNGTLENIDKKFDFNWGSDLLKEVPQNVNNIKLKANFERKVAIWGMKFKIVNGQSGTGFIEDIDSVKINGLRSYDVLNLKNGTFVGTNDEKEYTITIANKDRSKLNLTKGYIWTAFLAEDALTNFTITVYTQDGVYTKTASKIFNTGYDYRSNITVEKVTPQPYVKVNGVKWATGNFIHYNKGSQEYWGIAPAQWWISSYGENPTSVNKADNKNIKYDGLGSQNWFINDHTGKFTQTEEDVDLFQWGVIRDALKFNGIYYLQGTNFDMAGKYYKNRGGLIHVNETSNREEATHGDIVRYYTERGQKHYHYQYPSDADFNALFSANTCIPAYCYTDKGNKIYGAYFSDTKFAGSGSKFPTGRKIWKYQDVSGLVLANKGLFLPIGGRRPISSAYVEFRHVANNSGFYGQYYTSKSPTYSIPHGVFFGAAFKMNIAVPSKDQGSNIRPVYVGADNGDETKPIDAAKFAPFSNIIDANGRKY
ncbi:hypothetical protein O3680_13160 [Prevotella melaninogenica]|uniref:fimbrillin family protein n=1 Tax=Prevotella melaninogenica TaxID=28132 RepID=UPI00352D5255